jgi:chromosome segregation ATPase
MQSLETKLELLRSRSEEVTSNTSTDAQAKLLRQVETLQMQYALASENWQALESTLSSRVMALEKERDDIARREADIRKKAREINSKARRLEEDLEVEKDKVSTMESELSQQKAALARVQTRLNAAETALAEARAEAERERKILEKDLQSKLDEERTKWKVENSHPTPPMDANQFLRTESPTTYFTQRKSSSDLRGLQSRRSNTGSRIAAELAPLSAENSHPSSRRTSTVPWHAARTPTMDSAIPGRQESATSLHYVNGSMPPSASISVAPSLDALDDHMDRDSTSSPHRTVNELISVSAVGAGPSVQLVERMSAAVRRLESEKADTKEEMARILAQRDEAREEVVSLMREVEAARGDKEKMAQLEEEVKSMKGRYDAALEMLGEKSEECEELKNDVLDLKKIYRELVESTLK